MGSKKARVFPVPVGAEARNDLPRSPIGIVWHWTLQTTGSNVNIYVRHPKYG